MDDKRILNHPYVNIFLKLQQMYTVQEKDNLIKQNQEGLENFNSPIAIKVNDSVIFKIFSKHSNPNKWLAMEIYQFLKK